MNYPSSHLRQSSIWKSKLVMSFAPKFAYSSEAATCGALYYMVTTSHLSLLMCFIFEISICVFCVSRLASVTSVGCMTYVIASASCVFCALEGLAATSRTRLSHHRNRTQQLPSRLPQLDLSSNCVPSACFVVFQLTLNCAVRRSFNICFGSVRSFSSFSSS